MFRTLEKYMRAYYFEISFTCGNRPTKTVTSVQDCLIEDITALVDGFIFLVSDDKPSQGNSLPDKNIHQLSSCGRGHDAWANQGYW